MRACAAKAETISVINEVPHDLMVVATDAETYATGFSEFASPTPSNIAPGG